MGLYQEHRLGKVEVVMFFLFFFACKLLLFWNEMSFSRLPQVTFTDLPGMLPLLEVRKASKWGKSWRPLVTSRQLKSLKWKSGWVSSGEKSTGCYIFSDSFVLPIKIYNFYHLVIFTPTKNDVYLAVHLPQANVKENHVDAEIRPLVWQDAARSWISVGHSYDLVLMSDVPWFDDL